MQAFYRQSYPLSRLRSQESQSLKQLPKGDADRITNHFYFASALSRALTHTTK